MCVCVFVAIIRNERDETFSKVSCIAIFNRAFGLRDFWSVKSVLKCVCVCSWHQKSRRPYVLFKMAIQLTFENVSSLSLRMSCIAILNSTFGLRDFWSVKSQNILQIELTFKRDDKLQVSFAEYHLFYRSLL